MPRRKSKTLQGSGIQQMLNATKGPMTRTKKKRTRVLRLPDPILNPFCADRQIEDIYHEMTSKPKMIQDLDIKPPPVDSKHILPSSVFAPHKDLLQRRWAGQKISDVPEGLSHMVGSAMSHGVEKEDEVEAWQIPGQEDDKREEYKPPEIEEKFVRRVPKVEARVITFGHRPSSASRHFDPLTLNTSTVQYKKKGKKIPRVGLLSSSDLHKMLGSAAAKYRFQKEFENADDETSSIIYSSNDNVDNNRRKNNNNRNLNLSQSTPALNDNNSNNNVAPPMQTPKLDGSSQQMSLAIGVSTPIINDNNNSNMSQNLKNSNSGMITSTPKSLVNPHEFEAIKAPAWLGGVYAVGGGRSLFNGRKEDKGFKIKLEKDNDDGKWDNKIYYPPPQRAFKSALMEDELGATSTKEKISKYTKLSAGAIITPVCEERQFTDMLEARDIESRIMKSANTNKSVRVYQRNGVISSLTPRKTFSHDINEIQRTIKRQYGDNIWDVEDDGEEVDGEENSDEDGGSQSESVDNKLDTNNLEEDSSNIFYD